MDRVKKMVHYWCDDIKKAGLTGKGVTVAVLDTGLAPHPDFKSRVVGWRDCIYRKEKCYDDNGHGTHVTGILAGDGRMSSGRYTGAAPGCSIIALKVLDRYGNGSREDLLQAFRWIRSNREEYRIRVVNISVGTTCNSKRNHLQYF